MKPFPAYASGMTLILRSKKAAKAPDIMIRAAADFPEVAHSAFIRISLSRIWSYIHMQLQQRSKAKGNIAFILGIQNVEPFLRQLA